MHKYLAGGGLEQRKSDEESYVLWTWLVGGQPSSQRERNTGARSRGKEGMRELCGNDRVEGLRTLQEDRILWHTMSERRLESP